MEDYAWQCNKSLPECFKHVFSNELFCDVTLYVGSSREAVRAHKLVICSRSPVFYASFEGPLAEKGQIVITDIEKETFQQFLQYLYTDDVKLTYENVTSILYCARKYCVDRLTKRCEIFMEDKIDIENVFGILEEAHTYGLLALKDKCVKFLVTNIHGALLSESFRNICRGCVGTILSIESLNIDEERLFENILCWAEAECLRKGLAITDKNKRSVLGNEIRSIRFPAMTSDYFGKKVASSELLDADEVIDVFLYNFSRNDGDRGHSMFETASRSYRQVLRFRKTLRERQASDDKNEIAFECSIPATLHGVCVYTPKEEYETQVVSVDVFDHEKSSIASVDTHVFEHSSDKIHDVFLNKPVRLVPNKRYTVTTSNSYWVKSFYGTRGRQWVSFRNGTVTFYNSALSENSDSDSDSDYWLNTSVDKGQIPGLLLS
ncbi:BTB/POZ domain-containing protein 6-like [Saccostrea echinata]|uniref:BTB/POZ domain-containing protein 6-like n=1 Tax=Saccostrea echinata TaxID=191078 RepID=UPI002A831F4B|nr:BTB/POZ domain-containing protein 6-like [Saccostrea echinata]XP_061171332.1 BTB/POZ domain-containing protein 6-like [Saccostrea echinata]